MKTMPKWWLLTPVVLGLTACAVAPAGPSQLALPGTNKSFDQFRGDDANCRDYAMQQTGASPQAVAADSEARSALLGTAIGAVAGAVLGGGRGVGVGAGTGLLFGSAAGAGASAQSGYSAQQRYDNAYTQCMYANGNRVPLSAQYGRPLRRWEGPPPEAWPSEPPPPPAGLPPPPPEGLPPGPPA